MSPHTAAWELRRYAAGKIDRRELLARLNRLLGGYAGTQLFLESSGAAAQVVAPQEAQKMGVDSDTVRYPGEGTEIEAYLARPRRPGRQPAVLVIHENRGLNEHTREVARRFAAEGFVSLAPDALSRKGGAASMESPDKAREAIGTLTPAEILADLKAGFRYLQALPGVDPRRISSVGFCWGGARSFHLAVETPVLHRAVVFYGSPPPENRLASIQCPVLGLYGEKDERITSTVTATAEALKKLGKKYTYKIYAGADHAFFNDTGPRYDAAVSKDAWARALEFLRG